VVQTKVLAVDHLTDSHTTILVLTMNIDLSCGGIKMARRAFSDREHTLIQELLDKVRRTASNNESGNVLYNPQAFAALKPSLGHKSLTLSFMRSQLGSVEKLQKAVIDLVKHRLQVQNVQFPPLNINNMSWCIPRE
jgi:hypothetical protein